MEKRIKVYFFNIYQKKVQRGAERYVVELEKRLPKIYETKIISGDLVEGKRWPILWRFFIDPNGLKVLFFTLGSLKSVFKDKPEVVVALNGGWQVLILRLVTLFYGGKLIVSGQSGIGWDDRINLYCFPNIFVCLTDVQKKWAGKINPLVKSVVIPNGVDAKTYTLKSTKKGDVLGVGALDDWKRWDLLIKAVSILDGVNLKLIGKGKDAFKIKNMGRKLLGERFSVDSKDFNEMSNVYNKAKVFCYPTSPSESFGIVMVEAMASGLPVVATDDPIRREVVGSAGIFVDPFDTQKFAEAIKMALNKNWGDVPRKQAEKYDWNKIALKYDKLLREIA